MDGYTVNHKAENFWGGKFLRLSLNDSFCELKNFDNILDYINALYYNKI